MYYKIVKTCFLCICYCFVVLIVIGNAANAATTVNINGSDTGRTFDGMGAWSSGGNSRLLIDYPEPYRSDILDYLFKPNYGASLQHFRVEVGSGLNSTSGAEPSHAITRAELSEPVSRGYEFWFMQEARTRNPDIKLDCMFFAFPYWFDSMYSQDFADYIIAFLDEAKNQWGLELDWIAPTKTETVVENDDIVDNLDWAKNTLVPTLNSNGYNLNIHLLDGGWWCWRIFDVFETHPQYEPMVDSCGGHNIDQKPPTAPCSYPSQDIIDTGKKLWASGETAGTGQWTHARGIVERMNRLYIKGKITNMQVWNIVDGCPDGVNWNETGLIKTDCPWTGYYDVYPAIWAIAHYTQFTEVGWQYLDQACGYLSDNGNYVTLKDTNSDNWSTIIYAENAENITFNLGGVASGTVRVWKTTSSNHFIRQPDINVAGGSFSINCSPDSLYSLTTTSGQQKGQASNSIPSYSPLPLPYNENFESYDVGVTPKYLADMQGTFEVADCKGGRSGKCLQQMIPELNETYMWWPQVNPAAAMTVFGETDWRNYELASDIFIEEGFVYLAVRRGDHQVKSGYGFVIDEQGNWKITFDDVVAQDAVIKQGTIGSFESGKWYNVKIRCIEDRIIVYLDNKKICQVNDQIRANGAASIGSSFDLNQFDNISVKPVGRWNMVDEADDRVYNYGWNSFANSEFYGGTSKYSADTGEFLSFPFDGTQVRVYGSRRPDLGIAHIYLGSTKIDEVDCYAPERQLNCLLYESQVLSQGNYNLSVMVSGDRNPLSTNHIVIVDAFAYSEIEEINCPAPFNNNLALDATASSSSDWNPSYNAEKAADGNDLTRWNAAAGDNIGAWLELSFAEEKTFSAATIKEFQNRITAYKIQYYDQGWKDAFTGQLIGAEKTIFFDSVHSDRIRLYITGASTCPAVYEFEVYAPSSDFDGSGKVDMADMSKLSLLWLNEDCSASCDCFDADLNCDHYVDLFDFGIFSTDW